MRNYIRIFLVATVVAALMPPMPAYAYPAETEITYWTGCDATFAYVGEADQDCSGNWTYYGTQGGDWKREIKWNCTNEHLISIFYYHYCGGSWVVVSQAEFGACDLDC